MFIASHSLLPETIEVSGPAPWRARWNWSLYLTRLTSQPPLMLVNTVQDILPLSAWEIPLLKHITLKFCLVPNSPALLTSCWLAEHSVALNWRGETWDRVCLNWRFEQTHIFSGKIRARIQHETRETLETLVNPLLAESRSKAFGWKWGDSVLL